VNKLFNFLDKLSLVKYVRVEDNNIIFGKDKLLFYFVPHLVENYRIGNKIFGLDYGASQFLVGRTAGYQFVKDNASNLGKTLTEVVEISQNTLSALGWGKFSSWKVNEEKKFLLLNAEKSTVADEIKTILGPQEYPVDYLLSGLFAGATMFYIKEKIYCVEVSCRAQKNVSTCQFIAATSKGVEDYIREFAPEKKFYARDFLKRVEILEEKVRT